MTKKRKICFVTGSRAEYGLLYWLMKEIKNDPDIDLQIIATGMHLSTEFGLTYQSIEQDGFRIDRKVEMLISSDTPVSISKSIGLGVIGFADAFNDLAPDLIMILGDRYEILAAGISATIAKIPLGHIHGGETTEGAFDEAIRHSLTKMAWWHFVAAKEYQKRVTQLGEHPERIFMVGGLGVDAISKTNLLSKNQLEKSLGLTFSKKNLIITYHPVTLDGNSSEKQFNELLTCLKKLRDTKIIFTKSNSDTDGRVINKMIDKFVIQNSSNCIAFTSMGQLRYFSALQFVDAMVGNSSSGLLEAPTFKIGTIDIGDRQKGRLKALSVIDCEPDEFSIDKAITQLYSKAFQSELENVENPYGVGNATEKIYRVVRNNQLPDELKKKFQDI
jgi:GDP/UDP-N,N'-diacetylbacillosamine 2-epimerase (hydrolysing)